MMVCNDQNVQGVVIGNVEFWISQFADDMVLFLNGTEKFAYGAFANHRRFANMSGLWVDVDKTNAVQIGSKKGSIEKLCKYINVNCIGPSY